MWLDQRREGVVIVLIVLVAPSGTHAGIAWEVPEKSFYS